MEQLKKIGKALLFPPVEAVIVCVLASSAGLVWVFSTVNEESLQAYFIYILAFYTLMIVCAKLIPLSVRFYQEYKTILPRVFQEKQLRWKLYIGLTINWAYGGFQIVMGILHADTWLWTNGIYNIVLALIRFALVLFERKLAHSKDEEKKLRLGWSCYQLCGVGLLVLNLTMASIVFQRITNGKSSHYPGLVVYAVAAFTFYRLVFAIINVVRSRKNTSPILAATRNVDLSVVLLSLFSLQTTLFSSFGGESEFYHLMNFVTGGGVCLFVSLAAIGMLFHGSKIKTQINGG